MKRKFLLIFIVFISITYNITFSENNDNWYEEFLFNSSFVRSTEIIDPAKEKYFDTFWKEKIWNIIVNSALIKKEDFLSNAYKYIDNCSNDFETEYYSCSNYNNIKKDDFDKFINDFWKKWFDISSLPIQVIVDWMYTKNIDPNISELFKIYQWWSLVKSYNLWWGNILWFEKIYWWDSPYYYVFRMRVTKDTVLLQQADFVPYELLYNWISSNNIQKVINDFDNKIKNGSILKNINYKKRLSVILLYFKIHDKSLKIIDWYDLSLKLDSSNNDVDTLSIKTNWTNTVLKSYYVLKWAKYWFDKKKKFLFICEESWYWAWMVKVYSTIFDDETDLASNMLVESCSDYDKVNNSFTYSLTDSWDKLSRKYIFKFDDMKSYEVNK